MYASALHNIPTPSLVKHQFEQLLCLDPQESKVVWGSRKVRWGKEKKRERMFMKSFFSCSGCQGGRPAWGVAGWQRRGSTSSTRWGPLSSIPWGKQKWQSYGTRSTNCKSWQNGFWSSLRGEDRLQIVKRNSDSCSFVYKRSHLSLIRMVGNQDPLPQSIPIFQVPKYLEYIIYYTRGYTLFFTGDWIPRAGPFLAGGGHISEERSFAEEGGG